ncbi:hypothetical protein [Streptomyces sp. Ru62]|uniref:hypothetical protein n=1 Tax=Streptomyces sp. Ru62 TaxID=2080745 RepID=UPI00215660FB|nr:hypothetical protein [Streptomyces sp. Ru62]
MLYDLGHERFGNYVVVFDAGRDQVPVFTASGRWFGEATSADPILEPPAFTVGRPG